MVPAFLSGLAVTGSAIIFGSVLAGSLGVPVPALAAVIFVGSLLATEHGTVQASAAVFLAGMLGAVVGDLAWFLAGRRHGFRVLGMICRLSLSRDTCVRRTAEVFHQHGVKILLLARFVPGLSVVTAPLAGLSGVSLPRFLGFAESGAALWIAAGLLLGWGFADQVAGILAAFRRFGLDLGGCAAVLVTVYAGWSWFSRHRFLHRLKMARISPDELARLAASDASLVILDARAAFQRVADPFIIPGAVFSELAGPAAPGQGPVVVYCACPNEVSAAMVARDLQRRGYRGVHPLRGGIEAWREAGHPVHALAKPSSGPAGATLSEMPKEASAMTLPLS